jgi:hypothetical protein
MLRRRSALQQSIRHQQRGFPEPSPSDCLHQPRQLRHPLRTPRLWNALERGGRMAV